MAKLGLLFSGQGSQFQGMSLDFPQAAQFYDKIQTLTSLDLKTVIQTGIHLNETKYTQLAVFAHSLLAYQQIKHLNPTISGLLGFSLGEYSALCAASVFEMDQAIQLVYNRALYMDEAANKEEGVMAAVLGLDEKTIQNRLEMVLTGKMYIANLNAPNQIVISGEKKALEETINLFKAAGAKRIIPLNVSGAFHSPLMNEASHKLKSYLEEVRFNYPSYDIYMNVTGRKLNYKELKDLMVNQVVSSVRFVESLDMMIKDGFTHFIELGPGNVLTNLVKKQTNLEVISFQSMTQFDDVKGWLKLNGFIE
mgnify:FL=1